MVWVRKWICWMTNVNTLMFSSFAGTRNNLGLCDPTLHVKGKSKCRCRARTFGQMELCDRGKIPPLYKKPDRTAPSATRHSHIFIFLFRCVQITRHYHSDADSGRRHHI